MGWYYFFGRIYYLVLVTFFLFFLLAFSQDVYKFPDCEWNESLYKLDKPILSCVLYINLVLESEVHRRLVKGHIMSEEFFCFFNSSKNEQKTSALVARANFREYFVRFLEELKPRKIASEIIWTLVVPTCVICI